MTPTPTGRSRSRRAGSTQLPLFLAPILLLLACGTTSLAQEVSSDHTLLWRISGNGLDRPSYLYGTMHVTDERAFDFSDSVLLKLQECETFAMEISLDSATRLLFREIFTPDTTSPDIRDWLDDEQEEEIDRQLRNVLGLQLEQLAHVRPWLLSQFLREPSESLMEKARRRLRERFAPKDRAVALDPYLYRVARGEGKEFFALEAIDEQISLFDTIPYEQQVRLFLNMEGNLEGLVVKGGGEKMVTTYRDGDLDALLAMLEEGATEEFFLRKLLYDRNHIMAERIAPKIRTTTMFIAVGAGHLPGKEGLIELLRNAGFSVTPVPAIRTGLAARFVEKPFAGDWRRFDEKDGAYSVELPVEPIPLPTRPESLDEPVAVYGIVAPDIIQGVAYHVIYIDAPPSVLSDRDLLDAYLEMQVSPGDTLLSSEIDSTSAYLSGKAQVRAADGSISHSRIVVRGQRVYMLTATAEDSKADVPGFGRFLESLKMLDFPEPVLQPVHSDTLQIVALLPEVPEISFDTTLYPEFRTTIRGNAMDPVTRYGYQIARHSFSRFSRPASDSLLFERELAYLRSEGVSVDHLRPTRHGADTALEAEMSYEGQQITHRVRIVRHGREVYHLTLRMPRDMIYSPIADSILASIELRSERVESGSGSRIPEIAALLDTLDQTTDVDMSLGLYDLQLDAAEMVETLDILKQPRYDDGRPVGLRLLLLENLPASADSTIIPHLRRIYATLDTLPEHRHAVRYLLASLLSVEGNRWLAELLIDEEEVMEDDVARLMSLLMQYPSTSHAIFPTVLPLMEDPLFRRQLLWVMKVASQQGSLTGEDLERDRPWLLEIATRTFMENADSTLYSVVLIMDILERLPVEGETLVLIRAALEHRENYIAWPAAKILLRIGKPIEPLLLNRFAADPFVRHELYSTLDTSGRLQLFPERYMTQQAISEGHLARWLIDDDSEPDTIAFLEQLPVTVDGRSYRGYLFKFRFSDDGEWYVGLGSLQPDDVQKTDMSGMYAGSRYNEVGSLSRKEHVDAILEE